MATYLATATNGRFALTQTRVGGIPVYNAVDPTLAAELGPLLDEVPDIVRFFSALYGPYPFNAAGAIVDDAPDVGYALESQTKPNFAFVPDETTLVHELAHQWFGDAVTLRQWPDIWLHEGFAEWSEWIWSERHGGPTAQDFFDDLVAENDPGTWDPPPGLVPARAGPVQRLGLRPRGDDAAGAARRGRRRDLLPHPARLVRPAPYGNATTADFIALAQRDSHRNLRAFFQMWLYTPGPVETAPTAARRASRPRRRRSRRAVTGAAERGECEGGARVQRLHTHPKGGSHRGL